MGETTSLGQNYLDWNQYSPTNSLNAGMPDESPQETQIPADYVGFNSYVAKAQFEDLSNLSSGLSQRSTAPATPSSSPVSPTTSQNNKALLVAARVAPLAVALAACGGKDDTKAPASSSDDTGSEPTDGEPETMGVGSHAGGLAPYGSFEFPGAGFFEGIRTAITNYFSDNDGDGQSEREGDCDDTDPYIYYTGTDTPEEICDGKDNDCDDEIDEGACGTYSAWEDDYTASDVASSVITGDASGDEFGQSIASINKTKPSDTDDGYGEMVIGAPSASGSGAVYVVYGPTGNGTISDVSGVTITGVSSGDDFGTFISASSQNLDSAYLMIGAKQGGSDNGYVAFAQVEGLGDDAITGVADNIIDGDISAGYGIGRRGAWANFTFDDVDGDGDDDDTENDAVITQYFSSSAPDGALVFTSPLTATGYSDAEAIIAGASSSDGTGNAITAGDLDGDGIDDIIVGSETATAGGYSKAGLVNIQSGDGAIGTISISSVDLIVNGPNDSGAQLGGYVYAGDIDGDGLEDVMAGAPDQNDGDNAGCIYVFISTGVLTGSLGTSDANSSICGYDTPSSSYDYRDVGGAFSMADLDLDGESDFVYSMNTTTASGGYTEGIVAVNYGPFSDWPASMVVTDSEASQASFTGTSGDYIGSIIDTQGDRDGNGYYDILIGASNYSSDVGKILDISGVNTEDEE